MCIYLYVYINPKTTTYLFPCRFNICFGITGLFLCARKTRTAPTDGLFDAGTSLASEDSWMYPYQRSPVGNPYISPNITWV